jgi:hypothetical protein
MTELHQQHLILPILDKKTLNNNSTISRYGKIINTLA